MQTVYILEDDYNISEIEFMALKTSGFDTRCFEKSGDFFSALEAELPDLILLDVMLDGEDGVTVLKKLRVMPASKDIPVIMVTAKNTEADIVRCLDFGADDYITKPFSLMELVSRVKALIRRASRTSVQNDKDQIFNLGSVCVNCKKHSVTVDNQTVELTFKEFELLVLLLQNTGNVLTREVLLERIWKSNADIESRTVDMHIRTLRQKLGNEGERIVTVRNLGYKIQ